MFRPYETWYHASTLDTALEIIHVGFRGPAYIKVKARLFNRFNGIFYEVKIYVIQRREFPLWRQLR